jgi:hypothetical protein
MRLMRDLHKYFGLATALVVILVSATGILLVHRKALGLNKVTLTLPGYAASAVAPDAWDLAAADGSTLAATKSGVYRQSGEKWEQVLPSPTRQILPADGRLYAAAREGLFASGDGGRSWQAVLERGEVKALLAGAGGLTAATVTGIYRQTPGKPEEWQTLLLFGQKPIDVRRLLPAEGGLLLAAKEGLFTLAGGKLQSLPLPSATAGPQPVELQKVVTDLHNGDFFGKWFFLAVDLTAAGLILLTLTGVYLWWWPRRRRRLAR